MERQITYSNDVEKKLIEVIGLTASQVLRMIAEGFEVSLVGEKSDLDFRIEKNIQDYELLKIAVAHFNVKLATMEKVRFELELKLAKQGYSADPSTKIELEDITEFIKRSKQYQSELRLVPIYMARLEIEISRMQKYKTNVSTSVILDVEEIISEVNAVLNLFS